MDRVDAIIVNAFANPYYERFHLMCFWSVTDAQPWILLWNSELYTCKRILSLQINMLLFRSLANHKMALCYTQL